MQPSGRIPTLVAVTHFLGWGVSNVTPLQVRFAQSHSNSNSFVTGNWTSNIFCEMRNLIITRITIYNGRRGGEPSRLTLEEWTQAMGDAWVSKRDRKNLNSTDGSMAERHKLAYQVGKGNIRLVSTLIPLDVIDSLEKLVRMRKFASVRTDNKFLFPSVGNTTTHCRGYVTSPYVCINFINSYTNNTTAQIKTVR